VASAPSRSPSAIIRPRARAPLDFASSRRSADRRARDEARASLEQARQAISDKRRRTHPRLDAHEPGGKRPPRARAVERRRDPRRRRIAPTTRSEADYGAKSPECDARIRRTRERRAARSGSMETLRARAENSSSAREYSPAPSSSRLAIDRLRSAAGRFDERGVAVSTRRIDVAPTRPRRDVPRAPERLSFRAKSAPPWCM